MVKRNIFRRNVAAIALLCLTITVTGTPGRVAAQKDAKRVGWNSMPEILARIKAPTFPARDFNITSYGAAAGGQSDASEAIRQAIEACHAAGGGRVVVPAAVFLTGAIHLKSNVNLYLSAGATLKFSSDPEKYLPVVYTRFEGTECMNYSPLIYAFEQENIGITGPGTLDGSASNENWWAWARRAGDKEAPARVSVRKLLDYGERGVPVKDRVFGKGEYLRPNFIQPYRSRNILIEGIHIINSPMWEIHPVLSANITIRGVNISSHGPNNDGCDPESSRDVLIDDCIFDTGDDCIAIKSGRDNDGRRVNVPAENIIVRNSTMKDGHGGVVMGSECSGGIRNVFIENCRMDSPNLERALRFKSNARRGGFAENVFMRNVEVGHVKEAILTIDFMYETGPNGPYKPIVRNVMLENVTSTATPRVMWIASFPGAVIDDVRFKDCIFRGVESSEVIEASGSILFQNVKIEPANKGRSLNSRPTWP